MPWVCEKCRGPSSQKTKPAGTCHSCSMRDHESYGYVWQEPIKFIEAVGMPKKPAKAPVVIGDRMPSHFDYSLGAQIDSRSQEKRIMQAKGLRFKSVSEERQQHGGMEKRGPIISYKGQTKHKTRLEGVRTKAGERIV